MAHIERIQILSSAEKVELFGPPSFSEADQRYFFSFNDIELQRITRINSRQRQCMFAVLLGYFKSRPVLISPTFHSIKHDIYHIIDHVLPGRRLRPFNLDSKSISRIYLKIFELLGYQRFTSGRHTHMLRDHLLRQAGSWSRTQSTF